ncbi:MAG: hypothetical protein L6Q98_10295 [Anaerolineae bacterium]|nr:hypothetical protein [Anaerolineae bacterium]NUQ03191.1 hypothetical protein [Anaerolineae bacterium]
MRLDERQGMFRCVNGHKVAETLDEASERIRLRGQPPAIAVTFKGQLQPRARSLFETAHDYLRQGNTTASLRAFQDALDIQPEFVDGHLWIARISDDPAVKRDHLERALALDPGNLDALRDLMVLDGRLTSEEAERSRSSSGPILRRAASVQAETQALKCPICGGALTVDEENRRVLCRFCGHTAPLTTTRTDDGAQLLGAALLKQRAKGEKWKIGERVQHCRQCGAERTIPQGQLSGVCPFCGAQAVIIHDAAGALEQPDGMIAFQIDEAAAKGAVRERLRGVDERLYALMGDNKVIQASLEAVYLPFWVFDALIEVSQTITDHRTPHSRDDRRQVQPYENIRFQDGVVGLCIPAVTSPPAALVQAISDYDLPSLQAYDPRMLTKYPAAIYALDFDDASLEARSAATARMRERHQRVESANVEVNVYALVQQMIFQLLLLPVWVVTLVERDGDMRMGLVNGQNGRAILGSAQKRTG